jgi:hypothetical protein
LLLLVAACAIVLTFGAAKGESASTFRAPHAPSALTAVDAGDAAVVAGKPQVGAELNHRLLPNTAVLLGATGGLFALTAWLVRRRQASGCNATPSSRFGIRAPPAGR